MKSIMLTQETETAVTQALTQLIARATARQSAGSQQQAVLEKFRPLVVAARAENSSWSEIAATLKSAGITTSKTTLQRIFEPGKTTAKKMWKPATKKAAKMRTANSIKSPESHETIHAEFVKSDVAEVVIETPPKIVAEIPSLEPEIVEMLIPKKASSIFGAGLE